MYNSIAKKYNTNETEVKREIDNLIAEYWKSPILGFKKKPSRTEFINKIAKLVRIKKG